MVRIATHLAVFLLAASAYGQINVTQQPGAFVVAKQQQAPLLWLLVGPDGRVLTGAGAEWKQWLLSGQYTLMAIDAKGGVQSQSLIVNGTPGPGPGPKPDPQPDPGPGPTPDPTPGLITAALVCDPSGNGTETAQQVGARINRQAADYMAAKGYRWRQYAGVPVDQVGTDSAAEQFFAITARNAGKYPAIVIGKPGSSAPLAVQQVTDAASLLTLLKKHGGAASTPRTVYGLDPAKLKMDEPAPEGRVMGLIPTRLKRGLKPSAEFPGLQAIGVPDIPESQWFTFWKARGAEMRHQRPYIDDQDGLGACAGFAAGGSVETSERMAGLPQKQLCKFAIYALASYPADNGSSLDQYAEILTTIGVPETDFSPKFAGTGAWSNPKNWPAGWQENAKKHRVKAVDLGGNSASEGFHNLVVWLLWGRGSAAIGVDWPGGHSIEALDPVFDSSGKCTGILIANSWGPDDDNGGWYVRSRNNVTNGINTFGGPFGYWSPTFPTDTKESQEEEAKPVACPTGACPRSMRSEN